ncbi:MAG TPA: neutral zinc metallopeptidase [Dysgonomonas sp.]|uniref:neutral zinc metallopeptidase n=1 Tax=Dysgonomonas sp. TaxID=1891233 RepID=UPI002C8FFED6|nr:neutral zinc metallopeptidase [Dysgonomonas sp.]HML65768.1 neutral zinc metallopeptidase [Dysgonomonas sp.]
MKLDGRRTSENVDDRREKRSSGKISLGIGGTIIIVLIIGLAGGSPMGFMPQQAADIISPEKIYASSPQEESAATFAKTILAGTEDVWADIFAQNRLIYIVPEVGHHVQYVMGTLQKGQLLTEKESNELNVRLELQADFYAGVWACHDNENFNSLEDGDIEEGLNAASQIGDDRLQMQSQGYTVPDTSNHGASAQRIRWLKKGLQTGNIKEGNTFDIPYKQL